MEKIFISDSEHIVFVFDDDADEVREYYYNPDAFSGGQFVENDIRYMNFADIMLGTKSWMEFMDAMDCFGIQYTADIGTKEYRDAKSYLKKLGRSMETVHEPDPLKLKLLLKQEIMKKNIQRKVHSVS